MFEATEHPMFVWGAVGHTTLELYEFIIQNLDYVDNFNDDMALYLQRKMPFQQAQFQMNQLNVML